MTYPRLGPYLKYKTIEAELDAVRSRKKALSTQWLSRGYVETSNFLELCEMAFDRGLTLVLAPSRPVKDLPHEHQPVIAFALHHDELWRVPAYAMVNTLREHGSWNEAFESALLGYSSNEIKTWLRHMRWVRIGRGITVYTLLSKEQKQQVLAVGQKCFGSPDLLEGMTFFDHVNGARLKKQAARLIPRGLTLARVGLSQALFKQLLPTPKRRRRGVRSGTVSRTVAGSFYKGLMTGVELLRGTGWQSGS